MLLSINALMFAAEFAMGIVSESTALIADAMDMLADALVYGISLYAIGRAAQVKVKAAQLSGVFQILLGAGVLIEVIRRFILGSEPESLLMVAVGFVALAANVSCLLLIAKYRAGEVHMHASWIFSRNDVIANIGVILAGVLVFSFGSPLPDLVIGLVISMIVMKGGVAIVKDAIAEKRHAA
ncbi:MAG: cation transporter [Mariprofundaceae bacterium]